MQGKADSNGPTSERARAAAGGVFSPHVPCLHFAAVPLMIGIVNVEEGPLTTVTFDVRAIRKLSSCLIWENGGNKYTVIHLLVVDVVCVLFWTQSACMVLNQNTRNIYHKQMNNGVTSEGLGCSLGGGPEHIQYSLLGDSVGGSTQSP